MSTKIEWKSATDPKSGRIYYYNTRTKETTWNKPLELATPEEQRMMLEKKREMQDFFNEMENNIRRRLREAEEESKMRAGSEEEILYEDGKEDSREDNRYRFNSSTSDSGRGIVSLVDNSGGGRGRLGSIGGAPSRRVRTISTMDDEILLTMRQSSGEDRRTTMYARNRTQNVTLAADAKSIGPAPAPRPSIHRQQAKGEGAMSRAEAKGIAETGSYDNKADSKDTLNVSATPSPEKKLRKRRNSTGTIYIGTTMSSQDNDATIKCVCVVIRAHMISAAKEGIVPLPEYDIFKDTAFLNNKSIANASPMSLVPDLSDVMQFFKFVFEKSQLESDCIIIALIYCERLVKETKGRLCIRFDNWRSILFACLVMASKVWDDLSMWNVDFSQVYPSFDLRRVNALELAMLDALKYMIRVSASEYAKYYFHLRSMMVRLGYHKDDPNFIAPLDINGAHKLQISTERYENMTHNENNRRRHHSIHAEMVNLNRQLSDNTTDIKPTRVLVGLEHITHSEHMDADGQTHIMKKKSSQNVLSPRRNEVTNNAPFAHK